MKLNRTWTTRVSTTASTTRRVATVALVVLAALSGLNTVLDFLFGAPTDVVTPARTVVNKSAVVGSFAEDYVTTWLTATTSTAGSLNQFVSLDTANLSLPSTPAVVLGSPSVVAVTFEGSAGNGGAGEVFSVVVGVNERPYDSASPTRYLYRVAVLWSAFGPRATGLPFQVSGPGPGADLPVTYPASLAASDNAYQVVSGFLNAYLTGTGDITRYVTSDSRLVGIGAPYVARKDDNGNPVPVVTSVKATDQPSAQPAAGQVIRVLADVRVLTTQYATVAMSYPLTLRADAGHWSVAAIDRAPVLSGEDSITPVTPSSARPTN